MKLRKFGTWIWKWRWPLMAWLWLGFVVGGAWATTDFETSLFMIAAFIVGACFPEEFRKVRAKEARDDRQKSDSTPATG
jgi:hypothetical protein